jgi:hypothetical protein
MSLVVRFTPTGLTKEKYERAVRKLEEGGEWPPAGLYSHCFFGSAEDLRVSEIWDSREQFDAFGERLMPVLAELGIVPGEPEVFEVHNIIRR